MDFAVWAEVEKRLRAREEQWPSAKHETRTAFERRLDLTARALPCDFIDDSIMGMQRRCKRALDAEGGLFEEGGRSKRRPLCAPLRGEGRGLARLHMCGFRCLRPSHRHNACKTAGLCQRGPRTSGMHADVSDEPFRPRPGKTKHVRRGCQQCRARPRLLAYA